jgi:hypothetical protein
MRIKQGWRAACGRNASTLQAIDCKGRASLCNLDADRPPFSLDFAFSCTLVHPDALICTDS